MKKNSILITLIVFLLVSCGYKPILLNEKNNFNIKKIEIVKASRLNTVIKNSLNSISNKKSEKEISVGQKTNVPKGPNNQPNIKNLTKLNLL